MGRFRSAALGLILADTLLAAGDTFRAAAIEQLKIWGDRIGAPVISGAEGGDPASIVFDACEA